MIKGIFATKKIDDEKIEEIQRLGFNSIFTNSINLTDQIIKSLKEKEFQIFVEIGIFPNFCPNDKIVRQNKLKEIKKLMNLTIDGLWLDFIRFPLLWEIKNPAIKSAHLCSQCQDVKNRTEIISSFVAQVRSLINQSGKDIKLGMFSVPWRNEDFNGAIKKVIGQDLHYLAQYIDIFSPMVYHKMCGRSTKWVHEMIKYMAGITGKPVLPIVQTEDKPEKISKKEFADEVHHAFKNPSAGVIIFYLEDLLKDKEKIQALQ